MRKFLIAGILLGVFSIFQTALLAQQLTFNVSSANVSCEEQNLVPIEISVENFDSIANFQFAVLWDPAVLTYENDSHVFQPLFGSIATGAANGELRIGWADFEAPFEGENFTNGTKIITILFRRIGAGGTTTDVEIGSVPDVKLQAAHPGGTILSASQITTNKGSVNIYDNEKPTIQNCPADIAISIQPSETTGVATWATPSANDNCNVASFTSNFASGDNFPVGNTTVTYTAKDDADNEEICSFEVTVTQDANAGNPRFELPEIVIDCKEDSAIVHLKVFNFDTLSSLQFGIHWDTSVFKYRRHLNFFPAAATYFYTNPDSSAIGVRWADFQLPVGEDLPDDMTVLTLIFDKVGMAGDSSSLTIDDLPNFPVEVTKNGFPIPATDFVLKNGFVKLADTLAPVIANCPIDRTVLIPIGATQISVDWLAPTATDNCNLAIYTSNFEPKDTFSLGTTEVIYIATDDIGNADTCTFEITVVEDAAAGLPTFEFDKKTTGCSPDSVQIDLKVYHFDTLSSFQFGMKFDTSVLKYRRHLNFLPPMATFFHADANSPRVGIRWADLTLPIGENLPDTTTIIRFVFDVVGNVSDSSFIKFDTLANFPIEITKKGLALNSTGYVLNDGWAKVGDTEKPVFSDCPMNMTIPAGTTCDAIVTWKSPTVEDNCAGTLTPTNLSTFNSGDTFPLGIAEVVYAADDGNGNSDTCRFTITVSDLTEPTLRCRTDTSITTQIVPILVGNLSLVGAMDNCGVDTIYFQLSDVNSTSGNTDASNSSFEEGTTTVTYFGEDAAGNIGKCSFDVTIIKSNPVNVQIECPNPLPISNEIGFCDAEVNGLELQVTTGATDLTDTSFVINTSTPISGSGNASDNRFPVGTTTVTYTVRDTNGDDHSCTFSVTVNDTEMPIITCPDDVSVSIHPDSCDVASTWVAAMATDNCPGGISLSSDSISGVRLPAGTHPVTYMARDLVANEVTCTFNVIVTGGGAITFSNMPLDTTLKADTLTCSTAYSWIAPTANSLCGVDSVIASHVPGVFPVGDTEVMYIAYGSAGSTDTARFTITVQDMEMPVVIGCPNDTTVFANPATCTAIVNWTPTTATDNCGIFDFFKTHESDYEFPASIRPRDIIHIASDSSGNTTICNFKVTVVDSVKPYFPTCPAGVSVFVDGTIANDPDGFILFSGNDNCVGAQLFFAPVSAIDTCGSSLVTQIGNPVMMSGTTFGIGGHEVAFQASDDAGNTAECRVNITVNPLPDLNAQIVGGIACEGDDIQIAAALTGMSLTYSWTGPDNFTSSIIDPIITDVDASKLGDYIIVATSPNGCTTTDTVTVSTTQKPQLEISHNDVLCAAGVNDLDLTAADLANTNIKSWAWTGPQSFLAATQNATVSNVTPDNSGIYKIVACTVEGCIDSTELDIQISSTPIMPTLVTVGDDNDLCAGETATLLGETLNGQDVEYFWDVSPDNGVDWTPANINVLAMTFNEAGDFTIRYWGSVDGCLSDTAEVVVSVKESPSVVLGSSAPLLCTDGTESLELFVNGSADSYEWSGANSFSSMMKNPIRANVTALDAGIYTLKATNGDGCAAEENIQIEITEGPSPRVPVVEPAVAEICLGESLQYFGQPYSSTSPVIISWFASPAQGAGLPPGLNSRAIQVTPTEAGIYDYKYVVEVGGCSTDTTTVTLTVNDLPNVTLSYNAPLTCITEGMSLELSESGGTATSWSWSGPQTFTSTNQNPVIPNITKDVAGTYTIEVENAGGCKNTASIDVVISDGLQPLDITVSNANPCEDLDMLILETDMIPGAVYTWTGPITISTTTNQVVVPSATADYSGMYTVTATTTDGCVSPTSDSMSVEVLDAPIAEGEYVLVLFENPIDINVLGNDVFNMTRPFNITVVSPPSRGTIENHKDGTFTYTPDDKELDEDYMTYEICYEECDMLCSRAVVTFDIHHDPNQCVIPTVITPNNDGKNDMLRISCVDAGTFPDNELYIMNEWGDQVFHTTSYQNDWGGTYKGSAVPDGTYYYLFFRTPGSEPQKGFITVFR